MNAIKNFSVHNLPVCVYSNRGDLGQSAGKDAAEVLKGLLKKQDTVNIMFAAAPSQNELLDAILADKEIDWNRVNAFHMDEYINLDPSAPQGFGNFLRNRFFSKVPLRSVNYLNAGVSDAEAEAARYAALLKVNKLDICLMGVGENGHIAFNDPPVADFNDKVLVKVVELDMECRIQQVNDGAFPTVDQVPTHALTVTIPGLMSAKNIFCVVPGPTKAKAVKRMLNGELTTACPASILTTHPSARLYLDADSAKYVI